MSAGQDWFRAAAAGQPVVTSLFAPRRSHPVDHCSAGAWIASGRPAAVLIGDLDPAALNTLLSAELSEGNEVIVADDQHQLLYSSEMGEVADDAACWRPGVEHPSRQCRDPAGVQHR